MNDPTAQPDEERPLRRQVNRLAMWIVENVPGEPSQSEGAVDCAIRIMADLAKREEFYRTQEQGLSACIAFLAKLAEGSDDYDLTRDDTVESPDNGWTVTVDDGNQQLITGEFYPLSSVHLIAQALGLDLDPDELDVDSEAYAAEDGG